MATCNGTTCGHQELVDHITGRIEVSWTIVRADGNSQNARLYLCSACENNTVAAVLARANAPDMLMDNPPPWPWPPEG